MTSKSTMKIWDVALQTNQGLFAPGQSLVEDWIVNEERVPIAADIWVGRVGSAVATEIMDQCEAIGKWGGFSPTRQYAELYTYVREVPPYDTNIFWDPQQ